MAWAIDGVQRISPLRHADDITYSCSKQPTDHEETEHKKKGTPEAPRSDWTSLTILMRWHRRLQVLESANKPLRDIINSKSTALMLRLNASQHFDMLLSSSTGCNTGQSITERDKMEKEVELQVLRPGWTISLLLSVDIISYRFKDERADH
jgi:hypothetical protein